jgi:hypothetical protein
MKRKFILGSVILLFMVSQALATGINVYISNSGLTDRRGTVLSPLTNYHPYGPKLELFHNTLPAPNSSTGKLSVNTSTQYSFTSPNYKYQLSSLDGGTLYARVWTGVVAPTTAGENWYGRGSGAVAAGTATPNDWYCSLSTIYKADVPYIPAVGAITEALRRSGPTSTELVLTVPIDYDIDGPGGDGKRETTGFQMLVTYPGGSSEVISGQTINLRNTPTGTYRFVPTAINWWGRRDGTEVVYETLGLGGGAAGPVTYNLSKEVGGLGLNAVAVIHNPPFSVGTTTGVDTVGKLVDAINTVSGSKDTVSAIGWMEKSQIKGFYVTYNAAGAASFTATGGVTTGADTPLERGRSYQVSVIRDVSVTFSQ